MSDSRSVQPPSRQRFPWLRLLYAIGFAVFAWIVFPVIVLVLASLHFITLGITGRVNPELQEFSSKAVRYIRDVLFFITGVVDDIPFPLGPFPKA